MASPKKIKAASKTASVPNTASKKKQGTSFLTKPLGLLGWERLEPVLLAALATKEPLLLIGKHGTAKSFLLERLAQVLELDYRFYNASLINYDDLVGIPVPNEQQTALRYISTPTAIWGAEVVFIDELNRTRPDLQNKLFSIIHERRVQGIPLEKLAYRWAAMNPPPTDDADGDTYLGAESLDPALADRFGFLIEVPDWSDLSDEDRSTILLDQFRGRHEFPIDVRELVRATQDTFRFFCDNPPDLTAYFIALEAQLRGTGTRLSPRRISTLYRTALGIQSARITEVLEETKAKMSGWFGGGSVKHERVEGFWGGEDGTTVEEPVYLVFSNATPDKLEDHREDVMAHTAGIANRLTQEATALRIDRKMYQFPSTSEPRPHRCGGGRPNAETSSPHPADKLTKKRFLHATLQRVGSLSSVRDVFCNHLHYEFADEILPTTEWPEALKRYLAPSAPPRLLAQQNGFRIIYLQLANTDLRKGHERQLIQRLIKDDPALRGLVVVSDVAQTQWNLINVKFTRQQEADKKSDRLLLRRMRVGRDQAVRTAVERLIEVDIEVIGENKDAAAIQDAHDKAFDVDAVTKQFFTEIAGWYFWALPRVTFPNDTGEPDEKVRATSLIRLLTRLIFCWFLREKKLVPANLFEQRELAQILKDLHPDSSSYYQGILQNLFFATLNQRMGKDTSLRPYRAFAPDEGFAKNRSTYGIDTLYRYEEHFRAPSNVIELFADIPFLNGGLFECLDRVDEASGAKIYIEGFSRNPRKRAKVPNGLFFAEEHTVDLSEDFRDTRRRREKVRGLLRILHSYNFTIEENTPVDEEVALDPELLGKVFENLLASYNEETKTTARKQTGSFYTPRPIVDYMVDESLKAHLTRALVEKAGMKDADAKAGLDQLFTYNAEAHPFSESAVTVLITAIDEVKILDPACGSGAFPMGVLHKLVHLLGKLDPDNERWKQTQLAKLDSPAMREVLEASFADNNDDYGRKLYLIENCLYGVDIQPIAIQITKLRFFISLICDQKTNRSKKDNHGIRPLPNLETKFVAADTLIGLPLSDKDLFIESLIAPIEKEIEDAYHSHFTIQRRDQKLVLQKKIKALRLKLAETLAGSLGAVNSKKSKHLSEWDPFDPQSTADFFDPHWMFGRSLKDGFDIVIGNPPYIDVKALPKNAARLYFQIFTTAKNRINLYALFIEKSRGLISKHGIISFIIPNSLLVGESYSKLRQLILPDLTAIVKLPDGVFENAIVETMLLFVCRSSNLQTVAAAAYGNCEPIDFDHVRYTSFPKMDWASNRETRFSIFSTKNDDALCLKIEKASRLFEDVAEFCLGLTPYDKYKGHSAELIEERQFHSDRKLSAEYVPLISGTNITPFAVSDSVSEWLKYGPWLGAPRERRFFTEERIIVRQIASGNPPRIFAGYTTKALYHSQIGFAILAKRNSGVALKLLLALLNSKLLNVYHGLRFLDREKITFQKVLIANVRKFPFADPDKNICAAILRVVDEILELKSANPAADTSALEREIDQQVYALYGLTPEEIAIVEGTAT